MPSQFSRPHLGSLLLGYYRAKGFLIYAGRAGTGMDAKTLGELKKRLEPLAVKRMPLAEPPPRDSRFGRPLELQRVHWVRPKLVVEVTFLTWTNYGLLRQVVYQGLRRISGIGGKARTTLIKFSGHLLARNTGVPPRSFALHATP